jgi:cyclase
MLKKRVVATLVVRNGIVVQSIGFQRYQPVGRPGIAVEFLNQWGVDEIILLNISATAAGQGPDMQIVREVAKCCFVPLTVGGGIGSLAQARELIRCGADKVAFNQAALNSPELLEQTAEVFGSQCVVAAIDAIQLPVGHRVYDYQRRQATKLAPGEFAASLVARGAGEVFINSVDRDGSRRGFDRPLVREVCAAVEVPVICCGGAGTPRHFVEVFQGTGVHAASAANFFHFTEHCVTTTKAVLHPNVTIRHDTHADYITSVFDTAGRLLKKPDRVMEDMRFMHIQKEVI